jgi:hypothetical protein
VVAVNSILGGAAVALACLASVAGAGAAHADSNGYITELQGAGVPILGLEGPGRYINAGYTICTMLRAGETPEVAANSSGFGQLYFWKMQLVTAAQHNLCPDTLKNSQPPPP